MVSMHSSPTAQPGTVDAGGMNVSILGLAAELAVRDVEVDLLTRATGPATTRQLLPGVTLLELPAGPAGMLPKERLSEVADEFGEAVASLARRSEGYDVIHAHYWLSGIASLPVSLELGIPLVQSFHTVAAMKNLAFAAERVQDAPQEPLIRLRSESFVGRQSDAVIANSSAEASSLIDDVGVPADRVWVIPPGVDLGLFAPRSATRHEDVRRQLGLETDRQLVALAGRVQPLKGHELAIRALAELRTMRATVPVLVIAGEVTPGDEQFVGWLRELAADLGVADDVRFVGALHRDVLADLLSAASLTLVPSFSETFGLTALESAASGTPVIGFRSGGLSESVDDGVSGVLLGTREPRSWASELAVMIENDERRSSMGLAARSHAEHFTWGAAAASMLGVYASVQR